MTVPTDNQQRQGVDDRRGVSAGAMVAAVFGIMWTMWGATEMAGAASSAVRVAGLTVGVVLFASSAHHWRTALASNRAVSPGPRHTGPSLFSTRAFWAVAVAEMVAIRAGVWLITMTGHSDYIIVWVATVVGAHFLAFGRLFWAGFYWLGTALITAAIAGATVGLAGGGSAGITTTTGLITAASLFAASGTSVAHRH